MSTQPKNSKTSQNLTTNLAETTNSEEIDLVEKSLRANGCWETHVNLSECVADKRDWRACQSEVKLLQDCMKKANEKRNLKK
uniref:Uncharacterized protein n=1 Tax=Meloidogyne incognita TaxID=6306 RepID=A0A914KQI1_MELIC